MNHRSLFFVSSLLFVSTIAVASTLTFSEVSDCEGRPDFITEVRSEIVGGFEKLPPVVLVAKDAEYYVESKDKGEDVKIHSYQSFRNVASAETKVVCGTSAKVLRNSRFSLFAPTVIDSTSTKKVGQSLWQFQMLSTPNGFTAWNQRSLVFAKEQSLEKNLLGFGGNYRLYQIGPQEYEMVVSKTTTTMQQYLSVKFDAVPAIQF